MENYEKSLEFYEKGVIAYKAEEWNAAQKFFEESLRYGKHGKTFHYLGLVCSELGESEKAQYYFEKAFEFSPNHSQIVTSYAFHCKYKLGLSEEAVDILRCLLNRHPTYGPAKRLLKKINEEKQ